MDTITSSGYVSQPVGSIGTSGKRMINLLPRNPMDKTTIVSIYPRPIIDEKPTLFPSRYVIPAAMDGSFSLLVIEGASYFEPSRIEGQRPTEVQVNSMMLAESILHDSVPTMNLVQQGARPGVFAIPGEWNKHSILKYVHADGRPFSVLLAVAREWQQAYWVALLEEADSFWSTSNGNPKTIPQDARMAAFALGLEKTKPWMNTVVASELINCKACGEMINPAFPVCKFCNRVINKELYDKLGLEEAKK